jgi:UDP-N-acetylglucosamine/UDP-N-acetylgalactosamine diphosphorylase
MSYICSDIFLSQVKVGYRSIFTIIIMATIDTLRKRYEDANQGHLFKFWSNLTESQQSELISQLDALDIDRVNRIYTKAISSEKQASNPNPNPNPDTTTTTQSDSIEPLPKSASESVVSNAEKTQEWRQIGLSAITRGEVAVLLMAGGQGTRLGSSAPKGCYDIGLPSHKSLFQYQAERIARLQTVAELENRKPAGSVVIPWYVMTSGPTHLETEKYFNKNSYFGLDAKNVIFFEQGQ